MIGRLRAGGFGFDIVGHAKIWFVASGVLLVLSGLGLGVKRLNLGLEFRGGTSYQVQSEADITVRDMRTAVADLPVEPVVQSVGDDGFRIRTEHASIEVQSQVTEVIARTAGVDINDVNVTDVGPQWGEQITSKALNALVIFLALAVLYITLRFEWKMALTALAAMFHDLLATAGIYALTGFVVTPATVIAVLTILGYSLYDTVVIFDRIKDRAAHLSAAGRSTYSQMANESVNQVMVRSLNTSMTSLLPVGSLLFVGSYLLGAETLRELALALFIGMALGTYSSIFFATPLLALWKEREARWATLRARIAARSGETTAPRVHGGRPEADEEEQAEASAPVSAGPGGPSRPMGRPPRPPKNKRRKRRR